MSWTNMARAEKKSPSAYFLLLQTLKSLKPGLLLVRRFHRENYTRSADQIDQVPLPLLFEEHDRRRILKPDGVASTISCPTVLSVS